MSEDCHLCGKDKKLQNSHVIPRFAIKWIKETGATPFLRGAENPDERIQDYHEKLLCRDCEQSFSNYEREFANNIFHPTMDAISDKYEYGPWLKKFIISVEWRLLESNKTDLGGVGGDQEQQLREAKEIWGKILNGKLRLSADPFSHHIFFMGEIEQADDPEEIPDDWEFYIDRGIDATPVLGERTTGVYFKLPKILFFSCIQPPIDPSLENTEVHQRGRVGGRQTLGPRWGTFLMNRAEEVAEKSASEEEMQKIKERTLQNPEEAIESGSFEAHSKRMKRKIENHDPTEYLNEECPICYTEHRIVEFLPVRPLKRPEIEEMDTKNKFAGGVYLDGELAVEGEPENITGSFVISTLSETRIVTLYENEGWIIERELEHPEDIDDEEASEIGEKIWEGHRESLVEWAREQREAR